MAIATSSDVEQSSGSGWIDFQPQDSLVLVVDDNSNNLKVVRGALMPAGYRLTFANSGMAALDLARSARPDLVLLDLMMPVMDGLEVCQIMRKDQELAHIPIIFLTASQEVHHLIQAFQSGAVDYIIKPFNPAELLARVRTHLELHHLRDWMQRQAKQEIVMRHIISSIHQSLDLSDILKVATRELQRLLEADYVAICRHIKPAISKLSGENSAQDEHLYEVIAHACQECESPLCHAHQWHRLDLVDLETNPLEIENLRRHSVLNSNLNPKALNFLQQWQIQTELVLPIVNQNNFWGVISVQQWHDPHAWQQEPMDLLLTVAKQLAIAIHHAEMHQNLQTTNHHLAEARDRLATLNQELERLSHLDGLTQVANRRQFDRALSQAWQHMREQQKPLCLVMIDIDYFKQYNDTYGHLMGDQCLTTIAQALHKFTQDQPEATFARYGGEEFALILPNQGLPGVEVLAQQMLQVVKDLQISHPTPLASWVHVSISLGIASQVPTLDSSAEQLQQAADQALYAAKREGRNRYSFAPDYHDSPSL